ncbi:kinetochore associated 1 [Phyllostomus discolor]|uniref:Kinetochore associated 1 n=1 Tax=Phyllostomus discolor TaxID=89673 RepID=A0A833YYT9_9CHIR|nr:kinetochore associated 1 [Phyllostomus discolor]
MWNDIELLTSDDTGSGYLSVGSRKEHGTALYQVDLLAKISSEKASCSPKIQACSLSDGFVIVADQSVILLDSVCRSLQLHLVFDTEVDVVGLCQDGKFLLVGERSGNLHLIHVTSKQTLLTNAFVQKADGKKQPTYRALVIEEDGLGEGIYYMLLLTNNGFFCITNLQLAKIQQAIENVDLNKAKKGAGTCALSKWEPDPLKAMTVTNVMDAEIIKGAKKFQLIDNLLFVLDTDNTLSLWDVYTLTPVWNWPSVHVEEFLLTTEAESPSSVTWQGITNLKLVALTTTADKMKNLMVYSLPMMEVLYSLEVSSVSSLVQTGISTDTIYLLEGMCQSDPNLSEDPVSVLVLRCLTEALPENRLSRLLHKHRFAEAESFALQFGLDVELVYKVKANDILEKLALSSLDPSEQTQWQTLIDEAKENLHKIQDDEFVVSYCLEAQWITYETTQEMLNYAKTRLLKKEDRAVPVYSYGLKEVLRAHAKLTTFYGAFGPEKFSGSSWIEFLNNEDELKDIFLQLREGNLVCAQYLWLRHRANFESRFDVKMLENLLNSIPTPVSLQKLCPWLKNDVIPFVRRVVPDGQKILAKWLEQAARNLELTDKANWPENGLQLAEVFFIAEKPHERGGLVSSWHWVSLKDYENMEEVCQLRALVSNLRELITLHRKYNCRLALSDFEKETTTTIVFRMFDRVSAPELIPSVLEKFVRVYMREHDLQEEELLLLYIEDLLKRCSSKSTSLFETAWEAKAMAVIGCLSDTDNPSEIFELEEDEALRRVLYLLLSRPIDYSSRMLFIFATSATTTLSTHQLTFAHRTRALQCLLHLADRETIESLFKKPLGEVKSYLKCITFLASFEALNIPITYELFCNSPKEGMIKGLWKNHSHESMAVRLVAELCLEYGIYDLQLWNGLLQKLLGFHMIPYLRKVLTAISSIHSLWQVPYFSKAWQRVVQMPLLAASCPLSPSQLADCRESLVAILECPVSGDLDLVGVARQYVQLELPAFALACLMLMPHSEKRHQQIKNFLSSCDPQIILQQLEEHMSTGQLAGFSHQIRNLILNNIINKKEFGILAKTKYFEVLKLHTMNTGSITDLVNYLANELSLDEASVFVAEYSKHRGSPVPADAAPCEILKMFLSGS